MFFFYKNKNPWAAPTVILLNLYDRLEKSNYFNKNISERSIDSMLYARIGQPMVFQRNAFTSELRPGYDIPKEDSLNKPCRHFLDLYFV